MSNIKVILKKLGGSHNTTMISIMSDSGSGIFNTTEFSKSYAQPVNYLDILLDIKKASNERLLLKENLSYIELKITKERLRSLF